MDPMRRYPFLKQILSPFEARHQRTFALIVGAIVTAGQARSFAIASVMSQRTHTLLQSAVNRFYRSLRNPHVDEEVLVTQWARMLTRRADKQLFIAIDWTEWRFGLRLLVAAIVVAKRGIPLFARGFSQQVWRCSQNTRENDFLRVLARAVHQAGVSATVLCDRGFRRVSWLQLIDKHRLFFVVRLMDDVHVTLGTQELPLSSVPLQAGKVVDLGRVALTVDAKTSVRVIGYRAKGQKEAWWLATNREDPPQKFSRSTTDE